MSINIGKSLELAEKAEPGPWHEVLGSGNNLLTGVASEDTFVADCLPDNVLGKTWAPEDHVPTMRYIAFHHPKRVKEMDAALAEARIMMKGLPCIGCHESLGRGHFTNCPKSLLARYGEDRDD